MLASQGPTGPAVPRDRCRLHRPFHWGGWPRCGAPVGSPGGSHPLLAGPGIGSSRRVLGVGGLCQVQLLSERGSRESAVGMCRVPPAITAATTVTATAITAAITTTITAAITAPTPRLAQDTWSC